MRNLALKVHLIDFTGSYRQLNINSNGCKMKSQPVLWRKPLLLKVAIDQGSHADFKKAI